MTDAVRAAYARLREVDDPAITTAVLDEEVAAAKAEQAAARGLPLAGMPFMVKDNIDVAGLPTTAACPSFAYLPATSATAVARLEAAGAVAIAKTNMDQFATGLVGTRSPHGTPVNPLAPDRIPGGSSSGSAVAVAHGIVPFALGTDTAGSGRVPASLCGIVGLKPTRGWLSTAGVVPAVRSLDCVSVFADSVEDAFELAKIAGGFDAGDPLSRRAEPVDFVDAPRVGTDVDLSTFMTAGELLYGGPCVAERYAAVGEFIGKATDVDPIVASIIEGGASWSAVDAARAQERLAQLRRETEEVWRDYDVIVTPTVPFHPTLAEVAADPFGVNAALGQYTCFVNLLDLCAVALPGNVSVIGPAWNDAVVAAVAAERNGEGWAPPASAGRIEVAVVGAHLRGEPLHDQLGGAPLVQATTTAPAYQLFALAGTVPPKPGMVRVDSGGAAIEVEVYALEPAAFGRFTAAIPPPLCIGSVELADGRVVKGFLCEPHGLSGATEITQYGSWRAYLRSQ